MKRAGTLHTGDIVDDGRLAFGILSLGRAVALVETTLGATNEGVAGVVQLVRETVWCGIYLVSKGDLRELGPGVLGECQSGEDKAEKSDAGHVCPMCVRRLQKRRK